MALFSKTEQQKAELLRELNNYKDAYEREVKTNTALQEERTALKTEIDKLRNENASVDLLTTQLAKLQQEYAQSQAELTRLRNELEAAIKREQTVIAASRAEDNGIPEVDVHKGKENAADDCIAALKELCASLGTVTE